jgi:hypothetical protein
MRCHVPMYLCMYVCMWREDRHGGKHFGWRCRPVRILVREREREREREALMMASGPTDYWIVSHPSNDPKRGDVGWLEEIFFVLADPAAGRMDECFAVVALPLPPPFHALLASQDPDTD